MKNNLAAVQDTVETPDALYKSLENPNRKVYFKESELSSYKMYTKVITKSIGSNLNEIVSAWPQKVIKGGIGDEIYRK